MGDAFRSGGQDLPQQGHGLFQSLLQRDGVVLLLDAEGAVVAAVLQRLQKAAPPGGVVACAGGDEVPGAAGELQHALGVQQGVLPGSRLQAHVLDVDMVDVEYLGNENLICHVWDNLLSNAIKFSPCGGTIYIRMMPEGEKIRFSIENEGPQIREDSMKHIFDKFYQCDSSHKQEGNGLGLALVKQILNLCKGTISVENIPGSGCRFTVIL